MKSGKKPALGAAFSHARAVEAKTGGGKKKQRRVAMRYLHGRGEGISKAGGEGSRGGRVVGHSASGEPIYAPSGGAAIPTTGASTPKTKVPQRSSAEHFREADEHRAKADAALSARDVAAAKMHRLNAKASSAAGLKALRGEGKATLQSDAKARDARQAATQADHDKQLAGVVADHRSKVGAMHADHDKRMGEQHSQAIQDGAAHRMKMTVASARVGAAKQANKKLDGYLSDVKAGKYDDRPSPFDKKSVAKSLSKAGPTYGQYRDAIAQAQQAAAQKQADDRYAWAAYQALFQRNHDALAQLRADEQMRRDGRR